MLKGWFPAHCILRAATCKSTYHTCLFSAVPGPWRFSYNVFLYGFVLTRRSYLFRKEWVNLVVYSFCDHSAILFRGLCFLRLSGSGPGCPMCPVPRFLCLCLCRCLPKPSTMGLFALVSRSRFPAALLTSSPPLGIPAPHHLPSFQVRWKHTASFTFLQRSDKDTSHQLQTGDTGWVGTMTNETVSMSSKRSSCHSVPGCVARSSHL